MKMRMVLAALAGAALAGAVALTALPGCKSKAADESNGKPTAVATIFSYYDALRAIGGPDVNCVILLPPGKALTGMRRPLGTRFPSQRQSWSSRTA